MLFTDKASGNLFILMSARINKRKLYLCKKMGVFTIAKVVSSEKCNIILELLSKKRVVYWFPSEILQNPSDIDALHLPYPQEKTDLSPK